MKNICIIGFGSIGKYVFKNLIQDNIKIKSLICRHGREEEGKQALCSNLEIYNSINDFKDYPDIILDCAGHSALKDHASKALLKGINFITLSSGALCDKKLYSDIKNSEKKGQAKFIIAPGAIGSLDILSSASSGGIYAVNYVGRKPSEGWLGSRAEKVIDLQNLSDQPEVHFSGNAREASKLYPKNANVTATIAIAGIGFEKTKVKLIADNSITENIHELSILGKFGSSNFKISGKPLADNPRSSSLAAMSMVYEVKKFLEIL